MPKVLVSNNSELLRHFTAPPFRHLDLEILVARTAEEARALFVQQEPSLVILDLLEGEPAESLDVARTIKHHNKATRVILVAGKRLSGDQMREISASGCDELLIAPMTADELHDVFRKVGDLNECHAPCYYAPFRRFLLNRLLRPTRPAERHRTGR